MPELSFKATAFYCAAMIIGVVSGCIAPANAETVQDIEGLSVVVIYKVQFTSFNQFGQRYTGNADAGMRFYISTKGNIFLHGSAVVSRGGYDVRLGGNPTVFALNRAKQEKYGQTTEWTMMNGHLTQTTKLVRGVAVSTIAIDPARLSCTFDRQYRSDDQTGTIVSNTTGQPMQIEAYKVTSYSCEVKRGNIFASTSE